AALLPMVFLLLLGLVDFETGWDWTILEYTEFWTVQGFVRNLFYNGWHPIIPWLSFMLLGIGLSRFDLRERRVQTMMIGLGAGALSLAYALAFLGRALDPELAELLSVSPVPPLPVYMIAGSGAAFVVIGLSLRFFSSGTIGVLAPFVATGKQTLTLYIAHIMVGMAVLEALGMIGGQSAEMALLSASLFIIAALIYGTIWARFFKAGPIEWLMRRLVG
ncbi:MAG TPA: DUF418 domain-containing protein, partial [Devosia sp.]|nr:DUF418 domain-containing protein [Devosia sp.]